jgi:hypothetical protein
MSEINLSVLGFAVVRASDDAAQFDPDLICTECGERLCTVEDGDSVRTLADVALDHHHHAGNPVVTDAKVKVLHVRDPDSECYIRVWVDGVEVEALVIEDIDPGRGYGRGDWDERIADAEAAHAAEPSAFGQAVIDALRDSAGSEYIDDDEYTPEVAAKLARHMEGG